MVPTVPAGPPAGHRRMSSLRSTTLNFFKGNTKGSQLQYSSSLRRNELTISSPLPITEENVSPTTRGPPSRAVTDPMLSEKRHYFPASAGFFEAGFGRGLIPASEKASSIGDDDDDNESTITAGVESRQMSPSRQSDFDRKVAGSATATQSARSKKRGAKLKMALSLLRRRSNTNLRRAYGDPVDDTSETSRDRETFFVSIYISPHLQRWLIGTDKRGKWVVRSRFLIQITSSHQPHPPLPLEGLPHQRDCRLPRKSPTDLSSRCPRAATIKAVRS